MRRLLPTTTRPFVLSFLLPDSEHSMIWLAARKSFAHADEMEAITTAVLDQLPLSEIERVRFFKRDEITTDLICCDVLSAGREWFFHEEILGWELLLNYLAALPGYRSDWFSSVSQPAFATAEIVAFHRS